MGHLFSRAFKRITQLGSESGQSRSQQQENSPHRQDSENSQNLNQSGRSVPQSIPVGQSIDSAEYAALELTKGKPTQKQSQPPPPQQQQQQQASQPQQQEKQPSQQPKDQKTTSKAGDDSSSAQQPCEPGQDVEGAVIKIQALFRGHLTRKALRDAHQHHGPGTLGQSQFDEDSLTRNPPSAVFLPSSPLRSEREQPQQLVNSANSSLETAAKTPLESIAELTESQTNQNQHQQPRPACTISRTPEHGRENEHKEPTPLASRSVVDSSPSARPVSPMLGSASVSIDLQCDTPASASIDILDHNLIANDKMAVVLHHKREVEALAAAAKLQRPLSPTEVQESLITEGPPTRVVERTNGSADASTPLTSSQTDPNSETVDSEEAAAIRIQSAFRGYRSRKNSPYRTRSPNSSTTSAPSVSPSVVKRNTLRQQAATNDDTDDLATMDPSEQQSATDAANLEGRRSSRTRQRSPGPEEPPTDVDTSRLANLDKTSPGIQGAMSVEEFTVTDDTTVREVPSAVQAQQSTDPTISATIDSASKDGHPGTGIEDNSEALERERNASLEMAASEAINTLNEAGLSAALETGQSLLATSDDQVDGLLSSAAKQLQQRPSLGTTKSEASIDTDSSALGGALSLNEDLSVSMSESQMQASVPALEPIDEDRSPGVSMMTDELESEARKLVDEMEVAEAEAAAERKARRVAAEEEAQGAADATDDCALEEAANQLEEALVEEEAGSEDELPVDEGVVVSTTEQPLDDEEQRAIELESDDIERRDPRGQASEERAVSKSPQIRMEALHFTGSHEETEGGRLDSQDKEEEEEQQQQQGNNGHAPRQGGQPKLGLVLAEETGQSGALVSGQSSPALNSSTGASSSNEEDANSDHEHDVGSKRETREKAEQRHQQQSGTSSRNRKRNRNKKKGGKK